MLIFETFFMGIVIAVGLGLFSALAFTMAMSSMHIDSLTDKSHTKLLKKLGASMVAGLVLGGFTIVLAPEIEQETVFAYCFGISQFSYFVLPRLIKSASVRGVVDTKIL